MMSSYNLLLYLQYKEIYPLIFLNNEFQYKYFITIVRSMGQNILQTAGTTALSTFDRLVYFKSSNAIKQVIDLLGEETIMNALVFE